LGAPLAQKRVTFAIRDIIALNDRFRYLSRIAARNLPHMQSNAASATCPNTNVGKV